MTPTEERPTLLRTMERIDLAAVTDNPWQPRASLDPVKVQELAENIRAVGLLQAPLVRPHEGGYQIAFGHRRVAALRLLGLEAYELEVRTLSDQEMAVLALTENSQRIDVPAIEQYRAWQRALEIEGMTPQLLATTLGVNQDTITGNLRLLRLPRFILEHVDSGEMAPRAAREFLCLMGGDHFHEDVAKEVMGHLTNGVPDWRQARVRWELNEAVHGRPVAEWRKLYRGANENGEPIFDMLIFKAVNPDQVHAVAYDTWGGRGWTRTDLVTAKVTKEATRDWTCAVGPWNKAQKQAKAVAEGVVSATKPKSGEEKKPGKSSDFAKTLAQDALFQSVRPDNAGPLMKTLKPDQLNEDAVAALGTRATPALVKKADFKAIVDVRGGYEYSWGGNFATIPSYFPNIDECRKTCNIGAQYAHLEAKDSLVLMCLNQTHFDEKAAKGKATVARKVTKAREAAEAVESKVLGLVQGVEVETPSGLGRLVAAALLRGHTRFSYVTAADVSMGYQERDELRQWTENVQRIAALTGASFDGYGDIDLGTALTAVRSMTAEDVTELVRRLMVECANHKDVRPFAEALAAPELPAGE